MVTTSLSKLGTGHTRRYSSLVSEPQGNPSPLSLSLSLYLIPTAYFLTPDNRKMTIQHKERYGSYTTFPTCLKRENFCERSLSVKKLVIGWMWDVRCGGVGGWGWGQ